MRAADIGTQRVAIWGLGREGRAAIAFLRQRHPSLPLMVLDDTENGHRPDGLGAGIEYAFGADRIAGGSFHVRLHRRRGDSPVKLSAQIEERYLNDTILRRLRELGQLGCLDFQDPDYVIDIETVGERAGMSLWSRDDLKRFPFLRVD